MTKLRYKNTGFGRRDDFTLEWRAHPKGAELFQTGRGFSPDGFSLGVYSQTDLARVLKNLEAYLPEPGNPGKRIPRDDSYNHIRPVRYAARQGPQTRLAVCLILPFNWSNYSYQPPHLTLHEQGERTPWRSLGSYHLEPVIHFLRAGVQAAEHLRAAEHQEVIA